VPKGNGVMRVMIDEDGIVDIESEKFSYTNIRNMYKENINGAGIQVSDDIKDQLDDLNECCDAISKNIYKLQDIVNAIESISTQHEPSKAD
jgi:prefoldin subunit 5